MPPKKDKHSKHRHKTPKAKLAASDGAAATSSSSSKTSKSSSKDTAGVVAEPIQHTPTVPPSTLQPKQKRKAPKWRPITIGLRKIRQRQKDTRLSLRHLPFTQYLRRIFGDMSPDIRLSPSTIAAFQQLSEAIMINLNKAAFLRRMEAVPLKTQLKSQMAVTLMARNYIGAFNTYVNELPGNFQQYYNEAKHFL